jgi:uncharacterized damage-inducible protein DinB
MSVIEHLRRLFDHAAIADADIERALFAAGAPAEAWREYTHILGAYEVWLARLEKNRTPTLAVWPTLDASGAAHERERLAAAFRDLLGGLTDATLAHIVHYADTRGNQWDTAVEDILMHVALHGQYHRGKVNALLSKAGHAPAPADYITYLRSDQARRT